MFVVIHEQMRKPKTTAKHLSWPTDTTNIIHTLNTSAYHNSGQFSTERHQLPSHDYCYTDRTLTSHTVSFLGQ